MELRVARKLVTLLVLPLALGLSGRPPLALVGLAVGLWVLFLGLALRRPGRGVAARVEQGWERLDWPLGCLAIYSALFHWSRDAVAVGGLLAVLALALGGLAAAARRRPRLVLAAAVALPLLLGFALPRAIRATVLAMVASTHELTVDHRMKPDGREINRDGLRFRGEAEDLSPDDFVVLVLGDSFTFGFNLPYEASFPYVLEQRLRARDCRTAVRTVNFGWTSSSPLLGLRLLREVGHRYHPDLVLYALDATDFHDDIRYEVHLRRQGDFEPDVSEVLERLARLAAPGLFENGAGVLGRVAALWRRGPAEPWEAPAFPGPGARYFATAHPLERTREAIERGTVRHLAAMADFAEDVLGARMALVLYPRAYQYSRRESPANWESDRYERLGPWVREPFRYFAERAGTLPYPVLDLYDAFARTDRFPLFFPSDPHWNEAGAAFMAQALEAELLARGLVPCS